MIKNIGKYVLVAAIFLFVGLMLGVFWGRNTDGEAITLTQTYLSEIDGPAPTRAYHNESYGRVNINTATEKELTSIPGVGNVTAQRIVEYRKTHGKYYAVTDLLNIKGISESTLNKIMPYITVGG